MSKFKLYNADCLEQMKTIPDKSVDMILCDLPYGTTACKWDSVISLEQLWKSYRRILKPNGKVVLFSQGVFTANLIMSNPLDFKYKIVWEKSTTTNFLNAKHQPLRKHEDVSVFYSSKGTYNPQMSTGKPYRKDRTKEKKAEVYGEYERIITENTGERYPTDVVRFVSAADTDGSFHPTQKPVALLEYLIKTYTNEGETVLDNTMGSGSTGVACANTGRKFIGIEMDKTYFNIAKKRITEAYE